jgi:chromosome segregation ATPase
MEVNMLRKVSTLSIAGALIAGLLLSTPAYAAVSNGSTCPVVNKTTKVNGFTYKCVTAVKTSVTIDKVKTTIYVVASAKTKNAKKYFLANDCIKESASYTNSAKELAAIEVSTKKALSDIDAQIASQETASTAATAQIEALTQQNASLELKIVEQNKLITVAEAQAADFTTKIAKLTKDITDFTVILDESKASLKTLNDDTANKAKNAVAIADLGKAITKLNTAIIAIKSARSSLNMQLQKVKSSVNDYNSTILKDKGTISKNSSTISTSKNITATIESLKQTKVKTADQLKQAKDSLVQNLNSRNLLCRAGF